MENAGKTRSAHRTVHLFPLPNSDASELHRRHHTVLRDTTNNPSLFPRVNTIEVEPSKALHRGARHSRLPIFESRRAYNWCTAFENQLNTAVLRPRELYVGRNVRRVQAKTSPYCEDFGGYVEATA
jgi:hypothetical protein